MSDLFKDHGPELSDDEDRRLWQRVRAIPGEAQGEAPRRLAQAPWWTRLWAMPAVRYGAPALAVLLVAVVWVAERRPEAPARVAATRATRELNEKAEAPPAVKQEPEPAPARDAQAPVAGGAPAEGRRRDELAKEPHLTDAAAPTPGAKNKDQAAARAVGGAVLEREVDLKAAPQPTSSAPAAPSANETAGQKFAKAPAAPANEEPAAKTQPLSPAPAPSVSSWGATKSTVRGGRSAELQFTVEPGAGDRLAAGTLPSAAELAHHAILSDVLNPAQGGALHAWIRLPKGAAWAPAGWQADHTINVVSSETGATGVDGVIKEAGESPVRYDQAPARERVAVLAYLFEKSLAAPEPARLEALKQAALAIDPAQGGYGRGRLLELLDGALGAASAR